MKFTWQMCPWGSEPDMQLLWNCTKDEARNKVFPVTHRWLCFHQAVLSFNTLLTLICCLVIRNLSVFFPFHFQWHFEVFALNFLSSDSLTTIYSKLVFFHFQQHAFSPPVLKNIPAITQAATRLHKAVIQNFSPTAVKFHYVLNLRDLSNVLQVCIMGYFFYLKTFYYCCSL